MRDITPKRGNEGHHSKADELDRKFWVALGLYVVLAAGVFWAQVAEWLMAADCKSATLRVTEVRILPCAP